jgi:thiaminase
VSARELVEQLRPELAPVEQAIRGHRYLSAAPSAASLLAFVAEQRVILASDRRAFAQLAARFPGGAAGDFFLEMAQGEGEALVLLARLAGSHGLAEEELRQHELAAGCQAYTAFVSWLALNGSQADVAVAFMANLAAWGEACGRLGELLEGRCDTSFFAFFARPAPGFAERALEVADEGLAAGEDPARARRAARLLQAYELMFWDTLADGV